MLLADKIDFDKHLAKKSAKYFKPNVVLPRLYIYQQYIFRDKMAYKNRIQIYAEGWFLKAKRIKYLGRDRWKMKEIS